MNPVDILGLPKNYITTQAMSSSEYVFDLILPMLSPQSLRKFLVLKAD